MTFRYWSVLALPLAAFAMMPQDARAEDGFELCNRTRLTIVYAKAINDKKNPKDRDNVVSEGWFTLAPGKCEVLWPGKLQYRYYLIYAEAKASNRKWTGNATICVEKGDFRIQRDRCPSGRNHRKFVEVDTGDEQKFTYDLN